MKHWPTYEKDSEELHEELRRELESIEFWRQQVKFGKEHLMERLKAAKAARDRIDVFEKEVARAKQYYEMR